MHLIRNVKPLFKPLFKPLLNQCLTIGNYQIGIYGFSFGEMIVRGEGVNVELDEMQHSGMHCITLGLVGSCKIIALAHSSNVLLTIHGCGRVPDVCSNDALRQPLSAPAFVFIFSLYLWCGVVWRAQTLSHIHQTMQKFSQMKFIVIHLKVCHMLSWSTKKYQYVQHPIIAYL